MSTNIEESSRIPVDHKSTCALTRADSVIKKECSDCLRVLIATGEAGTRPDHAEATLRTALRLKGRTDLVRILVARTLPRDIGQFSWMSSPWGCDVRAAAACVLVSPSSALPWLANATFQPFNAAAVRAMAGIGAELRDPGRRWCWVKGCAARPEARSASNRHIGHLQTSPVEIVDDLLRLGEFPPKWDETDYCPLARLLDKDARSPDEEAMIRVLRKHKNRRARELLPGNELDLPSGAVADILQWIG